jgi:hypothetical protein
MFIQYEQQQAAGISLYSTYMKNEKRLLPIGRSFYFLIN